MSIKKPWSVEEDGHCALYNRPAQWNPIWFPQSMCSTAVTREGFAFRFHVYG